jgi:hypothetical protein
MKEPDMQATHATVTRAAEVLALRLNGQMAADFAAPMCSTAIANAGLSRCAAVSLEGFESNAVLSAFDSVVRRVEVEFGVTVEPFSYYVLAVY